ncbi:E7 [Zalophus californianus papillomavirus 1]|uniref:Protein E7 n=1 Tax=Zalophus californianus papillomavirus 1 TaxID=998829 RepID=F2X1C3_9PAPI|nr:E7 [Zalophus californianus papillomavirus 1]ADZ74261.1 E7 [Zalophus californianus papillomavirus 1]
MIGKEATLKDIVLEEQPTVADELWCDEELPPEEAEPDRRAPYKVHAYCGYCKRGVRLVIYSDTDSVQKLHRLLLGPFDIVCPPCAVRCRYNNGS